MLRSMTLWLVIGLTLGMSASAMADQHIPPAESPLLSDTCDSQLPGDADGNGVIDRDDVLFLFAYLCNDGPAPNPLANGDPNGDCVIDSLDLNYLMYGPDPVACTCIEPTKGACFVDYCVYQHPGDVNGDGRINVGDAAYLANFLYHGGSIPVPLANADVNGDCIVNAEDYACLMQVGIPEFSCLVNCTCILPIVEYPCTQERSGDANNDRVYSVGDAVYIISYIFRGGPAPTPYALYSGDANGDCVITVGDAVYLISYIFRGGNATIGCFDWQNGCGVPVH